MTELLSEFVSTRRDGWDRLDALVQRAGGRVHRLTPAEVRELGAGFQLAHQDAFPDRNL